MVREKIVSMNGSISNTAQLESANIVERVWTPLGEYNTEIDKLIFLLHVGLDRNEYKRLAVGLDCVLRRQQKKCKHNLVPTYFGSNNYYCVDCGLEEFRNPDDMY